MFQSLHCVIYSFIQIYLLPFYYLVYFCSWILVIIWLQEYQAWETFQIASFCLWGLGKILVFSSFFLYMSSMILWLYLHVGLVVRGSYATIYGKRQPLWSTGFMLLV
jgi:hypothetical protein